MIWLGLFVIIAAISAFLAWRSMKGYQEMPSEEIEHGLFLVRNIKALNNLLLSKLHQHALAQNALISFERLFKGVDWALLIFGPHSLVGVFPELNLLELEDYLVPQDQTKLTNIAFEQKRVNLDQAITWIIQPKNNPKKKLNLSLDFLKTIELGPNQRLFWQIVTLPVKNGNHNFQITLRTMAVDLDPIKRIELAKKIDSQIQSLTGLTKKLTNLPTASIYNSFLNRSLVPKELEQFILSKEELLSLLGLSTLSTK